MDKSIPPTPPLTASKSGLITLVGRSNTGKSTLLNTLVGTKIAAVTDKPQTTRNVIHGVLNHPLGQAVFVDTPGIFREHHTPLSGQLTERVHEAVKEIDLVIYVVDPGKSLGPEERSILSLVRKLPVPKILVINKSDLPKLEKEFLDDYLALADEFNAVFQLSALRNRHVQPLVEKVFELLPKGEPYYPPEQLTNVDKNFWVAELIREKIFLALRKEVPYTTTVEVDAIEEKPASHPSQRRGREGRSRPSPTDTIYVIKARVLTYDRRYKQMIIGAKGRAIKEIGIAARKELEQALNKKVYLELEVETDTHWMDRV
ncbi:MAG TPA: GTPase Era [Patescibacteria group bacterium]|nr:GTPase Era [Patescibacteria group bacterium]